MDWLHVAFIVVSAVVGWLAKHYSMDPAAHAAADLIGQRRRSKALDVLHEAISEAKGKPAA